jgi:hypothetical protein
MIHRFAIQKCGILVLFKTQPQMSNWLNISIQAAKTSQIIH